MTNGELFEILRSRGCTFDYKLPQNDHVVVRVGGRKTIWPCHDQNIEAGKYFIEKIKEDLGITPE